MAHGRTSRARAGCKRMLALLATLPTLLIGPVLGGDALLLHAHGVVGEHFHLVREDVEAEHHEDHGPWLALDHHDHELEHHPSADPSSPQREPDERSRLLISLPGPLHFCSVHSPQLAGPAHTFVLRFEGEPRIHSRVNAPAFVGTGPPGRTRPVKERSGLAAVLATSRAILI